MPNTKIKTSLLIVSFVAIFSTANAYAADIYVDANGENIEENGSEANPYHTIAAALQKAASNPESNRQVYVKAGNYNEEIALPDYSTLTGASKDTVVIDRENLQGTTVTSGKDSLIDNVTIRGGNYGIAVPTHKKTTIRNCIVEKTKRIGIWIKRSNKLQTNKFEMWDSSVKNNSNKGIFAESRFIHLVNNRIESNGEEGIDLRSKIDGTVSGNEIINNGEGGIEIEIRKVSLYISGNTFSLNGSNGITLNNRTNMGGRVQIKNNTIHSNNHYGIRCTGTKRWNHRLWKSIVKTSNNSSSGNKRKSISPSCHSS